MRILVTGATGFLGKRLVKSLLADGHDLVVTSRDPERAATELSKMGAERAGTQTR